MEQRLDKLTVSPEGLRSQGPYSQLQQPQEAFPVLWVLVFNIHTNCTPSRFHHHKAYIRSEKKNHTWASLRVVFYERNEEKKCTIQGKAMKTTTSDFPGDFGNGAADMDTQLPDELQCVRSPFTNNRWLHLRSHQVRHKVKFSVLRKQPAEEKIEKNRV